MQTLPEHLRIEPMRGYNRAWKIVDKRTHVTCAFIMLKPSGEVEMISTHSEHRRKGLATLLWNFLVEAGQNPKHSACRFPDGDAWARTVGGYLPPLHALPCHECFTGV